MEPPAAATPMSPSCSSRPRGPCPLSPLSLSFFHSCFSFLFFLSSVPEVPSPRVFLQSPPKKKFLSRKVSLECPTPESPWSAQPECPHSPWSAQPQSLLDPKVPTGVPSPRVSQPQSVPECPTPEYLYQERVGMFEVK